jgi:hypothetical protein
VAAALERALDQLGGIGRSADNLDNEIDVRIVDDGASIAREETAGGGARSNASLMNLESRSREARIERRYGVR